MKRADMENTLPKKPDRSDVPTEAGIEEQREFALAVRNIIEKRAKLLGRPCKAAVITYGCRQNENDSERIRGMLLEMGYVLSDDRDEADLVIFNTCAVRGSAEDRLFGNVGALSHQKRRNPDMKIAVCGCMMQLEENANKIKKSFPHVDIVFGTHTLWRLYEIMYSALREHERIFDLTDSHTNIAEGLPIARQSSAAADISIMYGCDNFCSYCVVPFVRGRERSRKAEMILREAQDAVSGGAKEIMLLGQNVNSYGRDLGGGLDFSDILSEVCKIEGDFLVRFMTSHPKDATDKLFLTMAQNDKIAKHLHLPFQSGDDRVLSMMGRGYTKAHYLSLIQKARTLMPDITVSSDVIVGFPGETYDEFLGTLDLVSRGQFDMLFTFIYSKRTGTKAAGMENQVPHGEKKRRFEELSRLQNEISLKKNLLMEGKCERVLVEGISRTNEDILSGRTQGSKVVNFRGDKSLIGQFIEVQITKAKTWSLYGEIKI